MNKAIRALLTTLLNQKKIGSSHIPEHKLITAKTQWLNKEEKKEFEKEYKQLKNEQILLCSKKRTEKGFDWHISLNPKRLKEVYEQLTEEAS
jgi:hydroxymethylpyrimidine/phosphomethylpyrimidine kinase